VPEIRGLSARDRWLHAPDIPEKLQIGAGTSNNPGWLNTDIEPTEKQAYLDATRPFPLPDRSFQYVFSEHVIEHLTYDEGIGMLKEVHRVLSPGGKVRIATPDLLKLAALLTDPTNPIVRAYLPLKLDYHSWPESPDNACFVFNAVMHSWGHRFVYTPAMMRASLMKAGFVDIRQYAAGESDDPALLGLDVRATGDYKALNAHDTMVFEAVRP
jgi:SAM-dependent methyltransferase